MQQNTNKLGTMPILKLITVMSLPAIFSMLVQALYNIVDSIYVGMISPTDNEITALNYAFPLQMIIFAVAIGIGIGTNSLIARKLGEKQIDEASRTAQTGLVLTAFAYGLALIGSFFLPKLFMNIYQDSEAIETLAIQYVSITMCFSFGMFFETVTNKILQSTGNMRIPMFSQLIGAITNIILDPIFIFTKGEEYVLPVINKTFTLPFGFGLGVEGAAIATVIGQIAAAVFVLLFLFCKKHSINIYLKRFRFQFTIIKQIFNVGIAAFIINSINSISTIIINRILNSTGVAVMGSYFKIQSFIFMPVFGLNQGLMPIFGYNYGAQFFKRFKKTFSYAMIIALSILSVGLLLFQTIPHQLLSLLSLSDDAMSLGVIAFRIISIGFLGGGCNIIVSSLYQSIGSGMKSMFLNLTRQAVFLIPIILLINFCTHDITKVWWAFPLAEYLCLLSFLPITIITLKRIFTKPDMENKLQTIN